MAKAWFITPGRNGDRTVEQQLTGLEELLAVVGGKTVLDVGAAEGLISFAVANAGASHVHGIEIVQRHVQTANQLLQPGLPCMFEVADANKYVPTKQYDVVLLLSVLNRMADPTEVCACLAQAARELVVVRLAAGNAPIIIEERSGKKPHDMDMVLRALGFDLERVNQGPFGEWTAYYRRDPNDVLYFRV